MKELANKLALLLTLCFLVSCGSYYNQPLKQHDARISESTEQTKKLVQLPSPKTPVVVGVYNFKDQTGQYKSAEGGTTFSTAVTQGATTILIKALEDSKWFVPIERENLGNLLNERNIIRNTRDEYRQSPSEAPQKLKPLLFAGILLEGGVISYDSNILTGGLGARYFGVGGSSQYRQDRITVYLRAVSTSTGQILKTVNVSKTILSQGVDIGVFKYVKFQKLLEIETGYTKNEPAQLAVQEAIEKAVELLIYEGIEEKLWSTEEGDAKNKELLEQYQLEKELEASTALYERAFIKHEYRNSVSANLGLTLIDGDYTSSILDFKAGLGYKYHILPELRLGFDAQIMKFNTTSKLNNWWINQSVLLEYNMLPHDKLSPYFFVGPGAILYADDTEEDFINKWDAFISLKTGAGLECYVSDKISLFINGEWNITFTDILDGKDQGNRGDYYYNFGLGLNYKF